MSTSNASIYPQNCGKLPIYYLLRAINPEANVFRQYEIFVTKDLFGSLSVMTRYGRIGGQGRTQSYSFEDYESVESKISQLLIKRQNASKRIGCDYQVVLEEF